MRKFLVVLDDTRECLNAMRFAALRAAHTGGGVTILSVIPPEEYQHWMGVADLMRAEARERIEAHFEVFAKWMRDKQGVNPELVIREGDPVTEILAQVREDIDEKLSAMQGVTASMIVAGQRKGGAMRLFLIYPEGNFIEATEETPFFQVGESKYGKPVLDRVINAQMPLNEAAKCALVSMDSTLKSNLSVGLPLDLVVYEVDQLQSDKIVCIDHDNPYFQMLHNSWGQKLHEIFDSIEDPMWNGGQTQVPIKVENSKRKVLKKITHSSERLI